MVTLSSSVLKKFSHEDQGKFRFTKFKRATNEIEHWARMEEILISLGLKTQIWQEMFMFEDLKT